MLSVPFSFLSIRDGDGFQMVGTYTEGRRLEGCAQESLLVVEIGPLVLTTGVAELARGQKTSRLSLSHVCCTESLVLEAFGDSGCGGAESCEISVGCKSVGGSRVYSRSRRVRNARVWAV
jgi:hypothetical protein